MAKKSKKNNKTKPSEALTCSSKASLSLAQAQRAVRAPGEGLPKVPPPLQAALSPGGREDC